MHTAFPIGTILAVLGLAGGLVKWTVSLVQRKFEELEQRADKKLEELKAMIAKTETKLIERDSRQDGQLQGLSERLGSQATQIAVQADKVGTLTNELSAFPEPYHYYPMREAVGAKEK